MDDRLEKPYYWNDEEEVRTRTRTSLITGAFPTKQKKAQDAKKVVCECGEVFYVRGSKNRKLCRDCQVDHMYSNREKNKKKHD